MKWIYKKPENVKKVLEVTREAAVAAVNFAFDNGADYYVFCGTHSRTGVNEA